MQLSKSHHNVLVALITLVMALGGTVGAAPSASAAAACVEYVAATDGAAKKKKKTSKKKRKKTRKKLGAKDFYVYDHLIVRGDTVGKLARRYGVEQDQILTWNDLLSAHLIKAGHSLVIYSKKRFTQHERGHYIVKKGDTLGKIARRFKMKIRQIRALNRIRGDLIRPGQSLVVLKPKGPEIARLGGRGSGKFDNPVQLRSGPGYHVRNTKESWGTPSTVRQLKRAFRVMRKRFTKTTIAVGDISAKRGGPLAGHRSHQRGLDVDLSFYRKGQAVHKRFRRESPKTMDARRTWALLDAFLDGKQVNMIFIDYALQKPLYEEARRRGMSKKALASIFQYPRGKRARRGIIRHEPGHADHIHVRFFGTPTRSSKSLGGRRSGASK